jgi:hypothetical protein
MGLSFKGNRRFPFEPSLLRGAKPPFLFMNPSFRRAKPPYDPLLFIYESLFYKK